MLTQLVKVLIYAREQLHFHSLRLVGRIYRMSALLMLGKMGQCLMVMW